MSRKTLSALALLVFAACGGKKTPIEASPEAMKLESTEQTEITEQTEESESGTCPNCFQTPIF